MPEVTRFFGIVVRMYFSDHDPAHFHAEYGEHEASLKLKRSPSSGESSRGGLWRWYSNGRPFIARNSERTGNGLVVERLWNPSPHWSEEET